MGVESAVLAWTRVLTQTPVLRQLEVGAQVGRVRS